MGSYQRRFRRFGYGRVTLLSDDDAYQCNLRIWLQERIISFGRCARCTRMQRLYDGQCYCCWQHQGGPDEKA